MISILVWLSVLLLAVYSVWRFRNRRMLRLLYREVDHSGPGRMNAHVFVFIRQASHNG